MTEIWQFIVEYWTYLTIPMVSGLVGLGTNWLAVKMMLGPENFVGIGKCGWQGVVPANAQKMARILVNTSIKRVLPQQEIIDRIDPDELLEAISHRIAPFVEEIVDDAIEQTSNYGVSVSSFAWTASPRWMKAKIYDEVREQLPIAMEDVAKEMKNNLIDIVDINDLVVEKILENKGVLSKLFQRVAGAEFEFLSRSGFYFGFPLGIPVMFIWYFFPVWWVLPVVGLFVGYFTNAIALYLLQKPVVPKRFGPWIIHGLFIKRQKEVSAEFGRVFGDELITADYLVAETMRGSDSSNKMFKLIEREVNRHIESAQGSMKPLMVLSVGSAEYNKMRKRICERIFEELADGDQHSFEYIDKAMDIRATISERMAKLPPDEFFQILKPVISEDEWKLVLVGAVLGCGAGFWQYALLT